MIPFRTASAAHAEPRAMPRRWPTATARRGTAQQMLRTLAYEVTVAEARERERIACGLHDDIGQLLVLVRLKLSQLKTCCEGEAGALVAELRELTTQAAQAVRSATFELCSPVLRLGLQPALASLADRLARAGQFSVSLESDLPPLPLSEPVQAVVFRVVRELCLNAQKHAAARHLSIRASVGEGRLQIAVLDDGCGFEPQACRISHFSREGGFGLASAQAQMQALGGRLQLSSAPGQGTQAVLQLALADRVPVGPVARDPVVKELP